MSFFRTHSDQLIPSVLKCVHQIAAKLMNNSNKYQMKSLTIVPVFNFSKHCHEARTTISQDVQTRSSVQLAFAKFLSKIKGNF